MTSDLRYKEFGVVKSVCGCVVNVLNLKNCFLGQLVRFGYGTEGIIMGFNPDSAMVLVVKQNEPLSAGTKVEATLEPFNMPTGEKFMGRVVNPLGEALDGQGDIEPDEMLPYFAKGPGIMDRNPVVVTIETGVKMVDTMLPLGHGQRSLIMGDKMMGKTTIGTDIILNQKGRNVICIYCAIGKPRATLSRVINLLSQNGCLDYTIVCSAGANTSPGQQYLAPYAACSLGEYFMKRGKRVFVLFDDFTKHAWSYRELSLLMGVPPGRDSYPGDVFYLHSRMIERAAQLNDKLGNGSMTFIAIVELLEGDLTAYVPTNLVSMTDGQIVLNTTSFNEGFRPALDIGLSVSRIGTKVQWKAMKDVSKSMRLEYIQYKELLRISKLSTGGISVETQEKLDSGKLLTSLIVQGPNVPVDYVRQIMVFFVRNEKLLKGLTPEQGGLFVENILEYAEQHDHGLVAELRSKKDLKDDLKQRITKVAQILIDDIKQGSVQKASPVGAAN
ncbi:MAG: F0F1 ATP synthase subunit alpha [Omnitrophica bacterium RIFCSPLOWO2_12_FULL_44_17]|uniref:F0F1 ATP synthase subunit alpha n=1 Tax=Candidatus Danuiimicrobium aquiferis TaxID=1801832 RepID=A0A1G1KVC9_9BACT|nr:MAG: F0F1 ATP synthase subunit alpha [Omnitrophica bacterium RIFCSPHIGHO2_02_FULL_45_28]OGW92577.1 MAG: F0F1 ATP synthase subunit alpha [Omnitrophica bacterium RIFCSPHIGHO2_12_FULL_44_12]OGW96908.1 MAG: F0F1 ATP synthase subunit alpha [Omnitrophica bacterium RIFCSPLOWO2_12_FULL_44_17]OGX01815.1 MAG: F0F1 ATP synthase subunit alpha [Omnitrophica bacterium RIFCSPLOWO2_02_FULL_44_11]